MSPTDPSPLVLVRQENGVAELTPNRPSVRNALVDGMLAALDGALKEAIDDPETGAILLTGAGPAFCSGAHLTEELAELGAGMTQLILDTLNPALLRIRESPKPVICALNGAAAGAGVGLALACDVVVASRSARMILSFSRIGAVLDGGTSFLLPHIVGPGRAAAMALTGEPIDAETALRFGLVWKLAEDDELMACCRTLAEGLARGAASAHAAIKRQLRECENLSFAEAIGLEAQLQGEAFEAGEPVEGISAFR